MQTMLQLNPAIPMKTPKGEGLAVMVIDYGPDYDLWWTVIVSKGEHAGEIWTYPNPQVRGVDNVTLGRQGNATESRPTNGHAAKGSLIDRASLPESPNSPRLGLNGRVEPLASRLQSDD